MLIYIALFIFIMVLAVEYEFRIFNKTTWLVIICISLGLMAGLRAPSVSKDYVAYQRIFDYFHELTVEGSLLPTFEPGFSLVVLTFRQIFKYNYGVSIMLFFGLTSVLLKILSIKKLAVNPFLVILFYYSHYFFLHEMTQIRIGLASAIFFVALIYYLRGQKLLYVLLILLAATFHYSAILYLLIFLLDSRYFNRTFFVLIIVISMILGVFKLPLLSFLGNFNIAQYSGKLSQYTDVVEAGIATPINVFNIYNFLTIGCSLYLVLFIPMVKLRENKLLLLSIKYLTFSVILLSLLAGIPTLSFRFSELFGILDMFVFASLARYLPFQRWNIVITVVIAAVFFYISVLRGDLIQPYSLIHLR